MEAFLYTVYLVRCADGTYYAGVTRDVARRIKEHNEGEKGAKYTKSRRPVQLVYSEHSANRSDAQKREHALRQLTRAQKVELVVRHGINHV